MNFMEMDGDARRILLDAGQFYEAFLEAVHEADRCKGGMRWKRTGDKEYLFKTRGGRGYGKSLGARSPETERIFAQFHERKAQAEQRKKTLFAKVKRQARFCIAAGVNRVPRIAANVIRTLDHAGLMGHGLRILGTHAIYAYEAASGVLVESGLMTTSDIDLLLDAKAKLKLSGAVAEQGLIGLLKTVDKTFEIAAERHFRATNATGFMVEFVKPIPKPPHGVERQTISDATEDLVAAEMSGFVWLQSAPVFVQVAIAEDGFPVRMHVPDPRFFALNKLWVSQLRDRNPLKRPRDRAQAAVVIQLAEDYLRLSFDDERLRVFPAKIRAMLDDIDRLPHHVPGPFHGM